MRYHRTRSFQNSSPVNERRRMSPVLRSVLAIFLLCRSLEPAHPQAIGSEPAMPIPSVTEALSADPGTVAEGTVPQFDVQVSAKIADERVEAGQPFTYSIVLRWEGKQEWLSAESPRIAFPESFKLIDSPIRSRSMAGENGPVGVKEFVYTLVPARAGEFKIPAVTLEILTPHSEKPSTLEASAVSVSVEPRTVPASETLLSFIRQNGLMIGGGLALALAGVAVFWMQRKKGSGEEIREADPWEEVDRDWQRVEALRSAGNDRDYFLALETLLKKSLQVFAGKRVERLEKACEWEELSSEDLRQELRGLTSEISERKYRPDRARPEELDRSLRQAKRILGMLKAGPRRHSGPNQD